MSTPFVSKITVFTVSFRLKGGLGIGAVLLRAEFELQAKGLGLLWLGMFLCPSGHKLLIVQAQRSDGHGELGSVLPSNRDLRLVPGNAQECRLNRDAILIGELTEL